MSRRRALLALLAVSAAVSSCSRPKEKMPDLRLPTLAGDTGGSLAGCPTPKCLTVYVSPWCGICRTKTPMFLKLRLLLKEKGVETRFIVGMDEEDAVQAYAQELGPGTLLDPRGLMKIGGVPRFIVSDSGGDVLNAVGGTPGPVRNEKALAWYLGLP